MQVPVFNRGSPFACHEGISWRRIKFHYFLTSGLDGGEWSASSLGPFTPEESDPKQINKNTFNIRRS
jgi:hypothetical protein